MASWRLLLLRLVKQVSGTRMRLRRLRDDLTLSCHYLCTASDKAKGGFYVANDNGLIG